MDRKTENPHSPSPTEYSTGSRTWTPPTSPVQANPRRSAWILLQCRQILSAYRRDDFADPEGFILQLLTVLERYPDDIIVDVTNPTSGIQRQCKFPPSIAEIVEACDSHIARAERLRRLGPPIQPQRHERTIGQNRANLYVPPEAPQYAAMVERSQRPDTDPLDWRLDETRPGIWVGFNWLDDGKAKLPKGMGRSRSYTPDELREIYGKRPEAAE